MTNNSGVLSRPLKWFYLIVLFALVFSGFGQMPIFKRYYLADLPGMAWTADFFVTLNIHYIAAALLLGICTYVVVLSILNGTIKNLMNARTLTRAALLGILTVTGGVLVARNLPGFVLPPAVIVAATVTHVAATMLFLIAAATYFRFGKKSRENIK